MINQSNKLIGPFLIDIKNKFTEIAGDDNKIDRQEFHDGLSLNSDRIVDRIFDIFDKDNNNFIDLNEFLSGIKLLIDGSKIEKIKFAFDVHDFDGSGDIDREELNVLIKNILIENNLDFDVNQVDLIVNEFFIAADVDKNGVIDFDEFIKLVHDYPDLINGLAVNPVSWFNRNSISKHRKENQIKHKGGKVQVQGLGVLQWLLVPRLVYLYNIIVNRNKNRQLVQIESLKILPEENISLSFVKPNNFNYKYGDYVYINCPWISNLEWYPFSIISPSNDENVVMNIKANTRWPNKVYKETLKMYSDINSKELSIRIDGPYGSISDSITNNENIIIVGAGNGVSKFASILQDLAIRNKNRQEKINVKNLYFIWLSEDNYYFEWFKKLLFDLQNTYDLDIFKYHIYFVDKTASMLPKNMMYISKDIYKNGLDVNLITHSNDDISTGAPDWCSKLSSIKAEFGEEDIYLFYSGPKKYKKEIKLGCTKEKILFSEQ